MLLLIYYLKRLKIELGIENWYSKYLLIVKYFLLLNFITKAKFGYFFVVFGQYGYKIY